MSNSLIKLDIPNSTIRLVSKDGLPERHFLRLLTDIILRLGGQRHDYLQSARKAALESEAMVRALTAGLTTGYYHTPAETAILSFTATSETLAAIAIAEHTRSTASATIEAGSVTGVTRGSVYYVYYDDAGNAGGSVTFAATTNVATILAAGRRTVGAIFVEPPLPNGGPG